jgi:hypothetical protein
VRVSPFSTLPDWDEMQAVNTFVRHSIFNAGLAGELDTPRLKQRPVVFGILHLDQSSVEIYGTGQGRDGRE